MQQISYYYMILTTHYNMPVLLHASERPAKGVLVRPTIGGDLQGDELTP